MNLGRLLLREIRHRKFNFLIGLLCVTAAVGCGVGATMLMAVHNEETAQTLAALEKDSRDAMAAYNDSVRRNMLDLGFNLMIVHKDQSLASPAVHGVKDDGKYLPRSAADTLAKAKLIAINHIVPFLQMKYYWPEQNRWVTLWGTTHEVYIRNPSKQKPIVKAVRPNAVSLGYALHKSLGLKAGDKILIGGTEFVVQNTYGPESPDADEQITLPLEAAQKLLGKDTDDLVTGLLAVDCNCAGGELIQLERDIQSVLPDTRVLNWRTQWLVRLETRRRAAEETQAVLKRERTAGQQLAAQRATVTALIIGLVAIVSVIFLGGLMWDNVRRRKVEIGVLRAIGITRGKLLTLFVGKALLIGLLGAVIGYLAGAVVAGVSAGQWNHAVDPVLLVVSVAAAAVLTVLASWIPAQLAAATDPAIVLQQENV